MAGVVPQHRPHEQLRTEAPAQQEHTDKYVSAFVSGESQIDMTFRNPILQKSADHFKVGVDDLTVNLSALSMLEYTEGDLLFKIIRRGYQAPDQAGGSEISADFDAPDGPVGQETKWRDAFSFKVDRTYNTMLEVLDRCAEIARAVGTFIRTEGLQNTAQVGANPNLWTQPIVASTVAAPLNYEHFRISITTNGQLRFSGTGVFWANFAIDVTEEKYRDILFRDKNKQFVSLHHRTGAEIAVPYTAVGNNVQAHLLDVFNPAHDQLGDLNNTRMFEYVGSGNILSTLDRRITLEVGCSLPMKNSPMIDNNVEAPDFVLGRFMLHRPYNMKSYAPGIEEDVPHPELIVQGLGTRTLQGARDRVCYHHLQPQQKIQTLRIKLWARVRSYVAATGKWEMKTIVCPMESIDYWHIKLHFVEKGSKGY